MNSKGLAKGAQRRGGQIGYLGFGSLKSSLDHDEPLKSVRGCSKGNFGQSFVSAVHNG